MLEILMEIYLSLGEVLIPDHKFKKWQEVLLRLVCIFVSLIIFALIVAGIAFISGENSFTGIILLVIGGGLLTVQIILCVIVLVKQAKLEKQKQATKPSTDDEIVITNL